jgi:alpha-galactosidase
VEQEENHEKGPRWSWARIQMGNPDLNEQTMNPKIISNFTRLNGRKPACSFTLIELLVVIAIIAILAGMMTVSVHAAITVTREEMAQKNQWVRQNLLTATNLPPFSFMYDGQLSSKILPSWDRAETDKILDKHRTQHVITWTNNVLQVSCVAVEYKDYPMVEWTVYLKNINPTSPTPILQGIQGLDITLSRTTGPEFVLHGNKGDFCTADSYEPFQITLNPSTVTNFSPPSDSGKSCDGPNGWPYYNLQVPGGGTVLAVGWPGQWASSFTRDAGTDLRIQAGQQLTHLFLNPGEEVRTPLIALLFWQGTNVVRAQNIWRHWYIAHEIPRVKGRPASAMTQIQVGGDDFDAVSNILKTVVKPDVCWRDAGGNHPWYPSSTGPYQGDNSWINTGTWEVDSKKYPHGFKPFSDWIHAQGMAFLLWMEPERVGDPNSWLGATHPEWLLPATGSTVGAILNEGNPAAFNWLTNHVDGLIKSNGIDWYREDMNGGGPLPTWRNNDATNRQGITENLYVQGHLAYWDALVAMNPGLRIDSCASGGRRNDLETMRRAVPLLRSDFQFPSTANVVAGNQCQTYGLSFWLPFQGTGTYLYDSYSFRSFYLAGFGVAGGLTPANTAAWKQAYAECKQIAPIMLYGDYYPLTPYSLADKVWMAWQFDRPEHGDGVVQAFRRGNCDEPTKIFQLNGLDSSAHYKITNFDAKGSIKLSGRELMKHGLTVEITNKPGAVVITYQRVK